MASPQREVQRILTEEFESAKARNPRYSLRAFARRLNLSPSAVSEMMRGKRTVTKATAERILKRLFVNPDIAQMIKTALQERTTKDGAVHDLNFVQVSTDAFSVISDWYYFAILSLAETRNFKSNPEWISRRLNVPVSKIQNAIEQLLDLGLLERTKSNGLKATGIQITTTHDVLNVSIQKSHYDALQLAQTALHDVSVEKRDITGITMAIDPQKLPEAKKLIKDFRRQLSRFLESGQQDEVYRLSIALFPLSRSTEEL